MPTHGAATPLIGGAGENPVHQFSPCLALGQAQFDNTGFHMDPSPRLPSRVLMRPSGWGVVVDWGEVEAELHTVSQQ